MSGTGAFKNPLLFLIPSSRNLVLLLRIVKLKSSDLLSLIWRPHWSWYPLGPVLLEAVSVSLKVQLEANRAIIRKRNSNGGRVGIGMNKGHSSTESPLLSTMLRGTSEGMLSPIGGQCQSPWSYDSTNGSNFSRQGFLLGISGAQAEITWGSPAPPGRSLGSRWSHMEPSPETTLMLPL